MIVVGKANSSLVPSQYTTVPFTGIYLKSIIPAFPHTVTICTSNAYFECCPVAGMRCEPGREMNRGGRDEKPGIERSQDKHKTRPRDRMDQPSF